MFLSYKKKYRKTLVKIHETLILLLLAAFVSFFFKDNMQEGTELRGTTYKEKKRQYS